MDHGSTSDAYRNVLRLQAAYYTLTGIWPIVHIDTFGAIYGPKLERWVVRTLGGVIAAVGASLWTAAHRSKPGPETIVLAVVSAAALGVSDAIFFASSAEYRRSPSPTLRCRLR